MKTVAIVPIKMNNVRTPGKNTKELSDGTPLISLIQKSLLASQLVDEVYVYCSNEEICNYLLPGVKYLKRDVKYDTAEADVIDMMRVFSEKVPADIYVQAHATTPFLSSDSIDNALKAMLSSNYDSALAVRKLQDFLWKDKQPVNYDLNKIPRTQDMEPYFIETTGLYIYKRNVIQDYRRRIGNNPYLQEVSEVEALDIDTPIDFEIVDAVYTKMFLGK